ncbi:hypothetical protein SEEE2558_12864 [Salmonella enterica subsp. enterica serovar Enteritidis str. 22558]|nr:hypothetical protein SEEE2558_12864 [Salmonella enterica subsp. enterica serovar Enteritidis str. 22558]
MLFTLKKVIGGMLLPLPLMLLIIGVGLALLWLAAFRRPEKYYQRRLAGAIAIKPATRL